MPTYEYRCDECDRTFDVVQSFHDDPLTECPTCGSPVRKVFGNVGIVFKGSGFYKTDSRSGGSSKTRESSSPSTSNDGADTSSSGDSGSKSATDSGTGSGTGSGTKKESSGTASPSTSPSSDKAKAT